MQNTKRWFTAMAIVAITCSAARAQTPPLVDPARLLYPVTERSAVESARVELNKLKLEYAQSDDLIIDTRAAIARLEKELALNIVTLPRTAALDERKLRLPVLIEFEEGNLVKAVAAYRAKRAELLAAEGNAVLTDHVLRDAQFNYSVAINAKVDRLQATVEENRVKFLEALNQVKLEDEARAKNLIDCMNALELRLKTASEVQANAILARQQQIIDLHNKCCKTNCATPACAPACTTPVCTTPVVTTNVVNRYIRYYYEPWVGYGYRWYW